MSETHTVTWDHLGGDGTERSTSYLEKEDADNLVASLMDSEYAANIRVTHTVATREPLRKEMPRMTVESIRTRNRKKARMISAAKLLLGTEGASYLNAETGEVTMPAEALVELFRRAEDT